MFLLNLIVAGGSRFVSECILQSFNVLYNCTSYKKFNHNFYLVCFYFTSLMLIKYQSHEYHTYKFHIFHYIYDLYYVLKTRNKEYTYHHIITLLLLLSSYNNFRPQGIQLIHALDHGNFLLAIGKCCSHLEPYTDRGWRLNHFIGMCSFFFFLISFVYYRLYWFLDFIEENSNKGFHFRILLWSLYALQIYWFYFVIKMTKKIITKDYSIIDGH